MSKPKTIEIVLEFAEICDPSDPNSAPYEIKRNENPSTNKIAPNATRLRFLTSVIPAAYER